MWTSRVSCETALPAGIKGLKWLTTCYMARRSYEKISMVHEVRKRWMRWKAEGGEM